MRTLYTSSLVAALVLLGAAGAVGAVGGSAVAVSPGSASEVAVIDGRCPTFSWGRAERADAYEIVVYRLVGDEERVTEVLRERLAGSLGSWTPALSQCLERGARYGWSVRSLGAEVSAWSPPRLFQVAAEADVAIEEALTVLRRYLEERGGSQPLAAETATTEDSPSRPEDESKPEEKAPVPAATSGDMSVEGTVYATAFAGDGSALTGVGDITAVNGNNGLQGGGTSGDVDLSVDYGGSGSSTQVSRSDHLHPGVYVARIGDTMVGDLTVQNADPMVTLNTTGSVDELRFQKDGGNRWSLGWNEGSQYLYVYDWQAPGGTRMVIRNDNGHMGVGTASPQNRLDVAGPGTGTGGVSGQNQVVARFKENAGSAHSAVSIDSDSDSILYLAKTGSAVWDVRFDDSDSDDPLEVRYHTGAGPEGDTVLRIEGDPKTFYFGGPILPGQGVGEYADIGTAISRWDIIYLVNDPDVSSDERLKTGIRDIPYGLDEVRKLRPVAYKWRDTRRGADPKLGLIAQEVEPIIPEAVKPGTTPEEMWSITPTSLIPVLIRAVQEQQEIIEGLEARLAQVESR